MKELLVVLSLSLAPALLAQPSSEIWSRVLVPLAGPDVHGANGSVWRTEITALIDSETPIEIEPLFCINLSPCTTPEFELGVPFDAYLSYLAGHSPGLGQFLYLRNEDLGRLHLNARVYDVSHASTTAGSEIPIVREDDFTSTATSLLDIPVAPEYRHTLRVYDRDGRDGALVAIRVYAGTETTPRFSTTRALTLPSSAGTVIDNLPMQPATLQIDLGQVVALDGINSLRVDIEPVDANLALWSFVSVTNNLTHHVTTVSAQ